MKKKWILLTIILLVVAAVLGVVFINLFGKKTTTELARNVNTVVESGYLSDQGDEYITINAYMTDILTRFTDEDERKEAQNYKDAYCAFVTAAEFYNRQICFTEYTTTYKNKRKSITNNLKKANKVAKNFKNYIIETKPLVGSGDYWNIATWTEGEKYMSEIYKCTANALVSLGEVYKSSVTSPLMNNDYTTIIIRGFEDILNGVEDMIYVDSMVGDDLMVFVNAFMQKSHDETILGYNYDDVLKEKVEELLKNWSASPKYIDFLKGNI